MHPSVLIGVLIAVFVVGTIVLAKRVQKHHKNNLND